MRNPPAGESMTSPETPYVQSRWSLADLFPGYDSPEIHAAFDELEKATAALEARRNDLAAGISAGAFMDIVRMVEANFAIAYRVYAFAGLWFTEDTQNQTALSFQAKVQQTFAELHNRILFFELWWKELDEANAARLMAHAGDYGYWLLEMRNFKPHTLSEAEEKIINIKNLTGARAMNTLYETITNRYVFKLPVSGEVKELTRGELMTYVTSSDADLRAQAYQELYRVYGDDGPILGQIYQNIVRDWRNENVDLRHFSNPIAVRNLHNDVPDEAVETLLAVCEKNTSLFQRYFRLKARWLGMEKVRRYDVYAPVVESDKQYTYAAAAEMVLAAFEKFHPEFSELAQTVLAAQHVDSEVRKGKQGGAFCSSVTPEFTPWVLLNYQGKASDVATMAHEFGHAIHALLAKDHTLFTFHSSLPLAETASTFAEMLLVDSLLAKEPDETVRLDMLFRQVDDFYATVMRQAFFAQFERKAHDLIQSGSPVNAVADAYVDNLKTQFGNALEIGDEFRWEWVSIPHFYATPFYVYAYTFGQLLVMALYQQYKVEGDAFKPRFIKILRAGGSAAPGEILSEAGIDIRSEAFWQGGFDVIAQMVDALEAIPVPVPA